MTSSPTSRPARFLLGAPDLPRGRAESRPARITGAALLIAAAVIHIVLTQVFPLPLLIVAFSLAALGLVVGSVLLLTRAPRLGWVVGGGTALLTAVAYVLRSTVGLPGILSHPQPFFAPPSGPISVAVEVLAVALACWALTDPQGVRMDRLGAELRALVASTSKKEPRTAAPRSAGE